MVGCFPLCVCRTVDTTPPLITDCSEDVSLTVPNTQTEATVDLPVPTATDNSMEMTTVLQVTGVTPNNVYPVGVTAITYIFADNYDNTNICQFTVTIGKFLITVDIFLLQHFIKYWQQTFHCFILGC